MAPDKHGLRTVDDLAPRQRVLLRVDINAPVEGGAVQDTKRFKRHAETISRLLADDHAVVVLAHQGRPDRDTFLPLQQHADILAEYLDRPISYVDDVHGTTAQHAARDLEPGTVMLLENTRFADAELQEQSPAQHAATPFVQNLHVHFDAYVNDAYSAAHRPHASLVGFPQRLDSYAGPVMVDEYVHNTRIQDRLDGAATTVLGGKKPADVLYVMEQLVNQVDHFLLGGVIGELFLRAEGHDVGYDVIPPGETENGDFMHRQWLQHRDRIKVLLQDHGPQIHLPRDLAYRDEAGDRAETGIHYAAKRRPYWDIGPETVAVYQQVIRDSDAVFVKGAAGVFEDKPFSYGTRLLLQTIADHDGFSVVGGGDTARCIDLYDLDEDRFDHVSLAGGAYIRALAGEELPAIEALQQH